MTETKQKIALGHDEQLIQEVGMMFEMGYVGEEFTMYGCAVLADLDSVII